MRRSLVAGLVLGLALAGADPAAVAASTGGEDPYAPLGLYQGQWRLTPAGGAMALEVSNHCARTGLFFACEQVVDGKPFALVVFQPTGGTPQRYTYRSQILQADGSAPGAWSEVTIEGPHWTYLSQGAVRRRTLNAFSGPDRIHYTVQHSADGLSWVTDSEGDEQRL